MGGDDSASTLMTVLFPTWPATPAAGVSAAFYELGMAASFFPLLAIAALPTVAWTRDVRRVVIVSVLVGLVLAYCMRSAEHTSELQSPMRTPYAVFCLDKNTTILNKLIVVQIF